MLVLRLANALKGPPRWDVQSIFSINVSASAIKLKVVYKNNK